MRVAKQLSVMLTNQPGRLAFVCSKLSAARVDIKAISVVESTEQAIVRMLVDKTAAAKKAMMLAGLPHTVSEVLFVEVTDKPGVLARLATDLSKATVNIQYVYGSTGPGGRDAMLVIGVDDINRAKKALAILG